MYLTIHDLRKELQVSAPAIRLWTKQGLPHKRFGRLVRFQLDEVLRWFAEKQAGRKNSEVCGGIGDASDRRAR